MPRLITGLDLGSSNIRAAAATSDERGNVKLLALENVPSGGVGYGNITDFHAACADIDEVIGRIERKIKARIRRVSITVNGPSVRAVEASGMIGLSKKPRSISRKDIDRCVNVASMISIPEDHQIVQKIVRGFYINEAEKVSNPLELYATKLTAKLYVIIAESAGIKSLTRCIESAGHILDGIVFSGTAISEALSYGNDEDVRPLILDIGSHLTGITLTDGKDITFFESLSVGAKDIAGEGARGAYFGKIRDAVGDRPFTGISVTGGGVFVDNLLENMESFFGVKARPGRVRLKWCNLAPSESMMHINSLGLIAREARRYASGKTAPNPLVRAARSLGALIEDYF